MKKAMPRQKREEEIQNVMETIGTDFYGLAKFAQSCSKKVKVLDLPPSPVAPVDDFSIDFGSQHEAQNLSKIQVLRLMLSSLAPSLMTFGDMWGNLAL